MRAQVRVGNLEVGKGGEIGKSPPFALAKGKSANYPFRLVPFRSRRLHNRRSHGGATLPVEGSFSNLEHVSRGGAGVGSGPRAGGLQHRLQAERSTAVAGFRDRASGVPTAADAA